ncbi:MAG: hypothetical protein VX435_11960 [Planctomycetota bacterium]|jgi:hypothetical protein|nr:hypothetical protein [Planctomycetota bacterium]MEE2738932.1 hypothetical protein [Planctomycetota bacterium]|tara:strand:- start:65 stop:388 length:324 start_codon:yes stop_codon:yes gene_type:complete
MGERLPRAHHDHVVEDLEATMLFLKRTRTELRQLRKVRVWTDRVNVIDVNGDFFEIRGMGYLDGQVVEVLDTINAAYKKDQIHFTCDLPYKEFKTGRRYAWAADRVM